MPGESAIIVLRRTDRQASYSVSYFTSVVHNDNYYLERIENEGKKQQIKYQGQDKDIFFYAMLAGNGYFWLFENKSASSKFDGKFVLELTNMASHEGETRNGDAGKSEAVWSIHLAPGEKRVKKLVMVDPSQAWGYKYSYSFKCLEELNTGDIDMD